MFAIIFIAAGAVSQIAKENMWPNRKPINLFENTYRMGSLVFGGGQVLMPMMYEQYSIRPEAIKEKDPDVVQVQKEDMYTGMGMVRAVPGPVFSIAAFAGGMALKDMGPEMQVLGCLIGMLAIFLPSALLVLFFFPIWNNLKKYAAVYRSLEGINAVVVGLISGSTLYLLKDVSITTFNLVAFLNILVITGTFITLTFTKVPAPVVVVLCLLLGWIF